MIGSLRGEVLERGLDGVVLLEVGGVGYHVTCRRGRWPSWSRRPSAFLYVHHHIREDAQTLYGFARPRRAHDVPDVLIATHGVGPALAMAILATHPPAALVDIVAAGDVAALTLVPGVGKKTAERLLVELQEPPRRAGARPGRRRPATAASAVGDVREALAGLGYGADEIREALRELPADGDARRRCCATPSSCSGRDVRDEFLDPAVGGDAEDVVEAGLRPRLLAEFVGQRELKEHLAIVLEAARRRGQAVDHLLFAGPPGLGKTTLAGIVAAEMGVHAAHHVGPGAGAGRRPGRDPHQARASATCCSSTRSTACRGRSRRSSTRRWRTSSSTSSSARARRRRASASRCRRSRSSARRRAPGMITGPLRDRFGLVARLDYYDAAELEAIVARAAGILDVADRRRRGVGDRPPLPGHAAHRQPPAAPGARLRRGARRRHDRRRHGARPGCRCSASTTSASTRSTGRSSARCASSSAAARSGCRRWRSRSASSPRRSRTSTSRSSSSRA